MRMIRLIIANILVFAFLKAGVKALGDGGGVVFVETNLQTVDEKPATMEFQNTENFCLFRDCPKFTQFNWNECDCVPCFNLKCPVGQRIDPLSCNCISSCGNVQCSVNQRVNPQTCQCESACGNILCGNGLQLNEATCSCEFSCGDGGCTALQQQQQACGNIQCNALQQLNPETCRCDCRTRSSCRSTEFFNLILCQCEPICGNIQCNPGQQLNPQNCRCECATQLRCGVNQFFNTRTCQCESSCGNIRCIFPQSLNLDTCQCECANTQTCNPPQRFNPPNCRCECSNVQACTLPQQFNFQTCQCQCQGSTSCPAEFIFNSESCQCLPLPTSAPAQVDPPCSLTQLSCNQLQILNTGTCACDCFAYFLQIPGVPGSISLQTIGPSVPQPGAGVGVGLGVGIDVTGTQRPTRHTTRRTTRHTSRKGKRDTEELDIPAVKLEEDMTDDESTAREKRQIFFSTRGTLKSQCTPKARRRGLCFGVALPLPQPVLPSAVGIATQQGIPPASTVVRQCPAGTRANPLSCSCV